MDGDYHQVNKTQLDRLERLLRGESDDEGSGEVAGAITQVEGVETMAKKAAGPQGTLGDWQDQVPKAVQEAADLYSQALVAKGKAHGKFNSAKDSLIELMKSNKCLKVRVSYKDSEKIIELEELQNLKLRKPKEQPTSDDDDEDDDDDN